MSKALTITVPVAGGKCQFADAQLQVIRAYLEPFNSKTVTVSFTRPKSVRSLKKNAYLWGVVYPYMASSTGNTTEDIHDAMKDTLLPRRFVKLGSKEVEIRKTTTDLTPTEFNEYIEKCCAFAAQELGVHIPAPGE